MSRCQHPSRGHQNPATEMEPTVGLQGHHEGPIVGSGSDAPHYTMSRGGRGRRLVGEGDGMPRREMFPKRPCQNNVEISMQVKYRGKIFMYTQFPKYQNFNPHLYIFYFFR